MQRRWAKIDDQNIGALPSFPNCREASQGECAKRPLRCAGDCSHHGPLLCSGIRSGSEAIRRTAVCTGELLLLLQLRDPSRGAGGGRKFAAVGAVSLLDEFCLLQASCTGAKSTLVHRENCVFSRENDTGGQTRAFGPLCLTTLAGRPQRRTAGAAIPRLLVTSRQSGQSTPRTPGWRPLPTHWSPGQ